MEEPTREQWGLLGWSTLVMATAGSGYMFSLFGPQLSAKLNYNQSQTAFIATCVNSGLFLSGPLFGRVVDSYFKKSRYLYWVAATFISLGYVLTSLQYSSLIPSPHFLLTAVFFLMIGIGSSATYHKTLTTCLRNWPFKYRGLAIGAPVSAFGLSAFIFTKIASLLFYTRKQDEEEALLDVSSLLMFVGIFCGIVNILMFFAIHQVSNHVELQPLVPSDEPEDESIPIHGEHSELVDTSCFMHTEAYLLAVIMLSLCGVGLMQINNVGATILAIYPLDSTAADLDVQRTQNLHVTLLSIFNFLGRVFTGFLSDMLDKSSTDWNCRVDRLVWPGIASLCMLGGSLMGALVVGHASSVEMNLMLLVLVSILIGTGYGATWTSIPVLVSEYFGTRRFATHWGFMTMLPAFGGQLTSLVYGIFYDRDPSKSFESKMCHGPLCFQNGFWFCVALCSLSLVAVFFLFIQKSRLYQPI